MNEYKSLIADENTALSSSRIALIVNNVFPTNDDISEMAAKILNYMHTNRKYVSGNLTGKVLNWLFILGYVPVAQRTFEDLADVIHRDFELMTPTRIVKSCLCLCYFRALPSKLIDKVFHIDFIMKLQNGDETSCSKVSYSNIPTFHCRFLFILICIHSVQNNQHRRKDFVMELNRAVCLEYPEACVPWFHQNYVKKLTTNRKKRFTLFKIPQKSKIKVFFSTKFSSCKEKRIQRGRLQ